MAADRHQIESFLYREARLMDEHQYDAWLSLWTDDALYWVPSNRDEIDPMREMSLIYVDRRGLEERIVMLKSGDQWSQEPKSRLRRIVSNVEFEEGAEGEVTVYSNFDVTEFRRGRQEIYAGRTIHKLRPAGDSFKIAFKKLLLVRNDDFLHNLTFLM
jgi:3-phenylpropionate/cinnamic acid dioxygenase small subunit